MLLVNGCGNAVGEATAITVDHVDTDRHRQDLAFLCGLVTDPFALADQIGTTDRKRLRAAAAGFSPGHPAWRDAPVPADAQITLETLIGD